jgi:hypothetical protein
VTQGRVLNRRLVPALLLVVPATAALSAVPAIVQAAEECRSSPGPTAPAGSRWYFRVNRTDHRRCWFLSSRAIGVHSQLPRTGSIRHRRLAGDLRQDQQVDGDPQATSTQTDHSDTALSAKQMTLPPEAAPSIDPSPEYLVPRSIPTIAYRRPPSSPQTVLGSTTGADGAKRASAGADDFNIGLLAGAAAAGLLFAGGVFHLTRQVNRRARKRGVREAAVVRSSVAAKLAPPTSGPADDLKRSLRELKRDLKRASGTYNLSPSSRKRAPSTAISLPHASDWLSRPEAEASADTAG